MTTAIDFRLSEIQNQASHRFARSPPRDSPMAGNGRNGGAPRSGAAPLPHIDDLTAIPRDIDPNQSIKRLLELSDECLRSAEMSREFGRPATALKAYVRASIIAVSLVKHHQDFPTLQSNQTSELSRKHNAVLKKINNLYDTYDQIKQDIKADNERTGVMPTVARPGSSSLAGTAPNSGLDSQMPQQNGTHTNWKATLAINGKNKPTPHPKPQALHGNAISNGHSRSSSTSSSSGDPLTARFAALRGPQASPGQDPRIKTHPFASPKPAGPREMPQNQKSKIGINSSVPSLPKMPDAIYSPVRGSMSEESARLPSSTPRGPFSRTGSSTSVVGSPSATPSATPSSGKDYFTPVYTSSISSDPVSISKPSLELSSSRVSTPKRSLDLAAGEVISAEELYQAMKEKGSVLIIDIRPREDFDEGHIMSSSVMCIEPSILLRDDITADDIYESMVISPNQEQYLFGKRNEFNLVVFYDQDSEDIPRPPRDQDGLTVVSLHRALVHLNYGRDLKQGPRLLKGGLDAWVELMGPASLQSTTTSSATAAQLRRGAVGRRQSKYRVTPMKADDVRAWQETVKQDVIETESSPTLYRSTEEFVRRYPAVSVEPEPMTAPSLPVRTENRLDYQASNKQSVVGDLPAPLTRPAPAKSRPSHSGLSFGAGDKGAFDDKGKGNMQPQNSGRSSKPMEQFSAETPQFHTGLNNPSSWCYANSILQSLLACEFGKELTTHDWKERYVVPKRDNEKIEQPQLMMQILANLFHWMSTGKFEVMKASTLMVSTVEMMTIGMSLTPRRTTRSILVTRRGPRRSLGITNSMMLMNL